MPAPNQAKMLHCGAAIIQRQCTQMDSLSAMRQRKEFGQMFIAFHHSAIVAGPFPPSLHRLNFEIAFRGHAHAINNYLKPLVQNIHWIAPLDTVPMAGYSHANVRVWTPPTVVPLNCRTNGFFHPRTRVCHRLYSSMPLRSPRQRLNPNPFAFTMIVSI